MGWPAEGLRDFLYDYVKVPGISLRQVLALGELTLRAALTYRDALPAA